MPDMPENVKTISEALNAETARIDDITNGKVPVLSGNALVNVDLEELIGTGGDIPTDEYTIIVNPNLEQDQEGKFYSNISNACEYIRKYRSENTEDQNRFNIVIQPNGAVFDGDIELVRKLNIFGNNVVFNSGICRCYQDYPNKILTNNMSSIQFRNCQFKEFQFGDDDNDDFSAGGYICYNCYFKNTNFYSHGIGSRYFYCHFDETNEFKTRDESLFVFCKMGILKLYKYYSIDDMNLWGMISFCGCTINQLVLKNGCNLKVCNSFIAVINEANDEGDTAINRVLLYNCLLYYLPDENGKYLQINTVSTHTVLNQNGIGENYITRIQEKLITYYYNMGDDNNVTDFSKTDNNQEYVCIQNTAGNVPEINTGDINNPNSYSYKIFNNYCAKFKRTIVNS